MVNHSLKPKFGRLKRGLQTSQIYKYLPRNLQHKINRERRLFQSNNNLKKKYLKTN